MGLNIENVSSKNMLNYLADAKPQIIEALVATYGEKYRDKITKNLNNTTFIIVPSSYFEDAGLHARSLIKKKEDAIAKEALKEFGLQADKLYMAQDIVGTFHEIKENFETKQSNRYVIHLMETIELFGFAKNLSYNESRDWIENEKNVAALVKILDEFLKLWEAKYASQMRDLEKQHKEIADYVENATGKIPKIQSDYRQREINFLGDHIKTGLLKKQVSDFDLRQFVATYKDIIKFDKDDFKNAMIGSFSKGAMMHLFKALGYDYGTDFEQYVNDENLMSFLFDEDVINGFRDLGKEKAMETLKANAFFGDLVETIKGLDCTSGSVKMLKAIYEYSNGCSAGAFMEYYLTSGGELKSVCVFNDICSISDHYISHECAHAAELSALDVSESNFRVKCGLEVSTEIDSQQNNEISIEALIDDERKVFTDSRRKAETLNEIIHDNISWGVTKYLRESGAQFVIKEGLPSDTTYSYGFPMFNGFIERNYELIIDAVMSENPRALQDVIGDKYFDKLCMLADRVVLEPQFAGMNRRKIISELIEVSGIKPISGEDVFEIAQGDCSAYSKETREFLELYGEANDVLNSVQKVIDAKGSSKNNNKESDHESGPGKE